MMAKKTKKKDLKINFNSVKLWKITTFILLGLVLFIFFFDVEINSKNSKRNPLQSSSQNNVQEVTAPPSSSGGCGV